MSMGPEPDSHPGKRNGPPADPPLDRDEKVKLDLPFEQALRALLETQPEPEIATPDKKRKP